MQRHIRSVVEPDDGLETSGRGHALGNGGVSVRIFFNGLGLEQAVLLDGGSWGQQRGLHGLRRVARRRRLTETVTGNAGILSHRHFARVVLLTLRHIGVF